MTWRSDGRGFVVSALTYTEAQGSTATVMLDGSVTLASPFSGFVAPNGLYASDATASAQCGLGGLAVQHEIEIKNVTDGSVVAHISEPTLNLSVDGWSPDGTSLLYQTATIVDDPANPGCKKEDGSTARWYFLPVDGSPPSVASGPLPARQAWWGARTIAFACEGKPVTNFYPDPPCLDANGGDAPVTASIHGAVIGSGLQWHTVEDVPAPQEGLR